MNNPQESRVQAAINKRNEENRIKLACKDCLTSFGRATRIRRLKMGLSIKGLANKMGCSSQQVLSIELHASDINLSTLLRLSRALETTLDYFVTVGAK